MSSLSKEYFHWIKYGLCFQLLIVVATILYVVDLEGIIKLNYNTYFFVVGMLFFSVFYAGLLTRTIYGKEEQEAQELQKSGESCIEEIPLLYKEKIQQVKEYFETNTNFLDINFSFEEFAKDLDTERHELTFLLNQVLKTNFYTLLAEERIKVAKRLLDEDTGKYTIEHIMVEVGFRSKSSFNKYFKQFTGYTPSKYRDKDINSRLVK